MTRDDLRAIVARKLSRLATVTLACMEEDTPIRGNVLASGDDALDRSAEHETERKLRAGNQWAWCTAVVTVAWNGIEACSALGCCSYASERAFRRCGYYQDLKREALDQLVDQVLACAEIVSQLGLKVIP